MLNIRDAQFKLFSDFISDHDAFVIAGHKEPDGDCIASSLGLAYIIKKFGKPCQVLSAGPFKRTETKKYEKLFSSEYKPLCTNPEKTGLFIVDCSEMFRLGETIEKQVSGFKSFIIDHHKTAAPASELCILNPKAPATAFLIQQLYEHFFEEPDKELAELLFFGLGTDTGFFRFLDSGSSDVFYAAGRLVKAGADPRSTYEDINGSKPLTTRKLLAIALDRISVHCGGKLLVTYETAEDTKKYGKDGRDTDILYQVLLATENVRAVAVFRQESEHNCTVGFRSKGNVDVSAVAARFGGGGHKNASGLSIEGVLDEIIPKIIKEFEKNI